MEIITFFEKLDKDILILTQEVKLFQIKLDFIIDASAPQMPKEMAKALAEHIKKESEDF